MKRICIALAVVFAVNCKDAPKKTPKAPETAATETKAVETKYPENIMMVFDAHGGLENWKKKRNLSFTIPKPEAVETHHIDLYSRKDKIEMPTASLGFDGKRIWLADEGKAYEGNAAVYHNLMFYFYAMPFVLADEGLNYKDAEPLEFEGKSYPGIHISFNEGVGASSKDDYFLYYDPETNQMAWLGYTFTYGSGEKSEDVKYIRYGNWAKVDGMVLPKTLTWYTSEGSTIKDVKNPLPFENIALSETAHPEDFYKMPENATVVE